MGNVDLSNDKNHLQAIAKSERGLSIGSNVFSGLENNVLYLSPQYCTQSIKDISQFFDVIFDAAGYLDPLTKRE